MGWQDEARAVRDEVLMLLRDHGEWVAPPMFGQLPVRTKKATIGEFHLTYRVPSDDAPKTVTVGMTAAVEMKLYALQVWHKGKQVAHLEWNDDKGPIDCRAFARGGWRYELGVV